MRAACAAISAAALAVVLLPSFGFVAPARSTLDIYFIDVEGGHSTLVVTPSRQSLLTDTGFAGFDGRDAGRIVEAARAAGISQIDYLLLTHFHWDHDGGVVELARQMPIQTFIEPGSGSESGGDGGGEVADHPRAVCGLPACPGYWRAPRAEARRSVGAERG